MSADDARAELHLAQRLLAGARAGTLLARPDAVGRAARRHAALLPKLEAMAAGIDHRAGASPAQIAAMFDAAARISPVAAAAFYSLGDPALLAAAGFEIASWLRDAGLIRPGAVVLDLGCGTGRMAAALRGTAGFVLGVDVSAAMLGIARRHGPVLRSSGRDVAFLADACFDLVLAVDSFPYLVMSGDAVAAAVIEDAGRVLRLGGALVILNLSYRGDVPRDAEDAAAWFSAAGLRQVAGGARPFRRWDGVAFVGVKQTTSITAAGTCATTFAAPL